ncbi:uncharacterized protein TNCV_1059221 [Trichonephila clavipes]|nr:uncharacterized protein TNCV_1059221 [Trichonephila clavipes]
MVLQTITPAVRAVRRRTVWGKLYRSPGRLHFLTRLSSVPKTNRNSPLNTTFCQSVTFYIDLAWQYCRRSCRCSGVKGSARKWRLDLRFASARCLEIVCGTIAMSTSASIIERVTMGSTRACRTILRSSLLVVFLVAADPVFRAPCFPCLPSRVHCCQQFLTAHSKRSTWPATRRVDHPAVFIPMIRPLLNSLNCEKCLLARLPGMFRFPKSSYNRRVIVPFMNLRICAGLYSTLFLIVAPPRRWSSRLERTATAGSDVVQSGRPIFDDFFQHLWPYIGNNTANVVFQMVKRLWLTRIEQ